MNTIFLIEIIKQHHLTIEKRIEKYDYFKLHLNHDKIHDLTVNEELTHTCLKMPQEEHFFLLQYGDIIYQSQTFDELTQYIISHFTL